MKLRVLPFIASSLFLLVTVCLFFNGHLTLAHPIRQTDETTPLLWAYSGGIKEITYRSQANSSIYSTSISNAINTWNDFGANLRLRTASSGEQVTIVNEYHPAAWTGVVLPTEYDCQRDGTCYLQHAEVVLNDYQLSGILVTDSVREHTVCHEFGHVLGLNHDNFNDSDDCTFYGNYSLTPGPHTRIDLDGMYPSAGTVPSSPRNLRLDVSSSGIGVVWESTYPFNAGQAGFKIERKSGTAGTYVQVHTAYNTTIYNDTNLSSTSTYCYRVRAYNGVGNSTYSNEACSTSAVIPGGLWVSPANGTTLTSPSFHFAAHAYPTNPDDPGIARVEFTVWWPAMGAETDPWQIACSRSSPTPGTDVYECDWSLAGLPAGDFKISFDVYDNANNVNRAPNGVRTIHYSPPTNTPTAGATNTPQPQPTSTPTSSSCSYAPNLTSPGFGQTLNSRSVTFNWNAPSGCSPDGYTFRISQNNNPENSIVDTGVGGTSYGYTFSQDGQFYWHVRACKPCTPYQPGPWATSMFVISTLSEPTPIPTNPPTNTPVPTNTPSPTVIPWAITLAAGSSTVPVGTSVTLFAQASKAVGGSDAPYHLIQISDLNTGLEVVECWSGTTCSVDVTQTQASTHAFVAKILHFLDNVATSNQVSITWTGGASTPTPAPSGSLNHAFNKPVGVAIDPSSNIYVLEQAGTVYKFDSSGNYLALWSIPQGPNGYSLASSIAVDGQGNVYVGDITDQKVRKFSASGSPLAQWQIYWTASIAVGNNGNIYVSDGSAIQIHQPLERNVVSEESAAHQER